MAVVVSDTSVKNQVATSIAYIHISNNPVIKTLYHVVIYHNYQSQIICN